uniref:Uncharacterized protein n=1 Tax=Acrobeloides nanus TaxID=290746 RepID=A0A914EQ85_9BILA
MVLRNSSWLDPSDPIPVFIISDISNSKFFIMISYATFLVILSYSLIIFFNVKVWRFMAQYEYSFSTSTKKLQKQLTYALIVTAVAPVFTAFFPLILAIICVFFHIKTSGVGLLVMMAIVWNSTINSTCANFLVKPYREAVIKMLKALKNSPDTIIHGVPTWATSNTS